MKITQIRNATLIIEYDNTRFLIDPWLGPKGYMLGFETAVNSEIRQPRVELPFSIDKIVNVDSVIITHIHPDHWDEYAEHAIDKNLKIFVQSEFDKNFILSKGFEDVEILTEQGTNFRNITLYKTHTQHGHKAKIDLKEAKIFNNEPKTKYYINDNMQAQSEAYFIHKEGCYWLENLTYSSTYLGEFTNPTDAMKKAKITTEYEPIEYCSHCIGNVIELNK